jgi:UrcA family protein
MTLKLIFAVPAMILALSATPGTAEEFATAKVSYAGLDLASPEGVSRLDKRVAGAIRKVCRQGGVYNLTTMRAFRQCIAETTARTDGQRERVIMAYLVRHGKTQLASR